jgi:antitoxin component of RelBE/YafQ-DinJ toxin-antitoxin module
MKTQMMQFRVNDEEKALIEKCAKKAGMTVSEYIRACMLMEMVIDGEVAA